ncbi:sugar nucleotide-binding protein [Atopomonas sediminilitoris]|uniref:sugar nucleotide-binding protein n=1 Tax=Atopomonas sediminilitoris TaxID=2919919 RepID=UPI001F4EBF72|nr:sugar nucleotide-binding protein [Atopomonas sediminilitoris]MCJ8168442.1 NAD(P)-dependent oxidoreductase [Atopomonas sediminilitoris]
MRMRLLLLGGGSALGQALLRQGAEYDIGFIAPIPPAGGWDAPSLTALVDETRPDAIINFAFYHDWFQAVSVPVERLAEQERAVARLASLCQHHDILLIQPSSFRVFDGARSTAYTERDEPLPLGELGHALWRIEQSVRAASPRHVLLRFGWLLDNSLDGWLGRFLQLAAQQAEISMADDRRGMPTPVEDAARVVLAVIQQLDCDAPLWGLYQYGSHEPVAAHSLANLILQEARLQAPLQCQQVTPVAHSALPDAHDTPQHVVFNCKKIMHTFGIKQRAWRVQLTGLLDSYYRQGKTHE